MLENMSMSCWYHSDMVTVKVRSADVKHQRNDGNDLSSDDDTDEFDDNDHHLNDEECIQCIRK